MEQKLELLKQQYKSKFDLKNVELKTGIKSLKELQSKLQILENSTNDQQNWINRCLSNVTDDNKVIIEYLIGLHKGEKYAESLRKFALTLRIYSPKAYDYLREKFNNNLPHPSTIRKWYQQSQLSVQSGLCQRSLKLLEDKVQEMEAQGKSLYCGIIHDEMSIRQHLQWLNDKKEFSGFINFGKIPEGCETLPIASHVLVFLLSGINISFHLPIAYYFISELEGIDKVILLTSLTKKLSEIGVKVLTSTFDGHSTNISACEILGCAFDLDNFQPRFLGPNDIQIHAILDPPHMLKLIRNHLANRKVFFDRQGREIKWQHFELLLNDEASLNTHKMTKLHINFQRNIMKVSLAAQTFSNSVSQAMQTLLDRKHSGFEDAAGTIEFCKRMDTLFDILNSDMYRPDNQYKSPITSLSKAEIFGFLDNTYHYIKHLTLKPNENPIVESEIKIGFKGMLVNIQNLKAIVSNYVEPKIIELFPVRSILQCSLESFFSRCRSHSMLGFNTNPTVSQFQSSMRKLLLKNEVTSSVFANCNDQLDILYVSSSTPSTSLNMQHFIIDHERYDLFQETRNDLENIFNSTAGDDDEEEHNSNEDIGIAFTAGEIELKFLSNKTNLCILCREIFAQNVKLNLKSFPKSNKSQIPCRSTFELCEKTHHSLAAEALKKEFSYANIMQDVIAAISPVNIFSNSNFALHPSHKDDLIRYIVDAYISIRATYIAKKATLDIQFMRFEKRKKKINQVMHFQGR